MNPSDELLPIPLARIPLARIAHARSGDKADWVDFGLFARNAAGWRLIER